VLLYTGNRRFDKMTKNPLSFFRQNDKKLPETLYDSALALFPHFRYTVNQQRKLRKNNILILEGNNNGKFIIISH
jgi:hypothetical protein